MQELEKILEEIESEALHNSEIGRKQCEGMAMAMYIIRKHMNDGWIPVDEALPEDGQTVLCTDGEYVYLVEYDADLDAPFGELDNITHWQSGPKPYRPERSDNHDGE